MLWIVGKIFPDFREYLEKQGIEYGVFWDQELPVKDTYAMPIVPLDFSRPETLGAQAAARTDITVSALIVAGYENYVLPASYIARELRLPAPSVAAAEAATDKLTMRAKFLEYDRSLTPDFTEVATWEDIERFMDGHEFPVVLKPASLMKSLLITKNESLQELRGNFEQARQQAQALYAQYSIAQAPRFIIEEFLVGSMHTVAGFVGSDGDPVLVPDIVDCVTGQEIGFSDNFLFSRQLPTRLSAAQQAEVLNVASEGMKALGLTNTPAHIELILTRNGPKLIEIGARIGGYRTRMYQAARGLDLYKAALDTAYDRPFDLEASKQSSCAAIELFPDGEGPFVEVAGSEAAEQLPSVVHFSIKPKQGDRIGRASQGHKAAVVAVLVSEDPVQLEADIAAIRDTVRVIIEQ